MVSYTAKTIHREETMGVGELKEAMDPIVWCTKNEVPTFKDQRLVDVEMENWRTGMDDIVKTLQSLPRKDTDEQRTREVTGDTEHIE